MTEYFLKMEMEDMECYTTAVLPKNSILQGTGDHYSQENTQHKPKQM